MSQENVELARAALAAFIEVDEALVDRQQLEEFFMPDAVTTFSGFMQEAGTLRGFDEFLEWRAAGWRHMRTGVTSQRRSSTRGANGVVVTLHQRGKPRGSDSWVEMRYGLVYTVEEGLISRIVFYATPEEALEAAGLLE